MAIQTNAGLVLSVPWTEYVGKSVQAVAESTWATDANSAVMVIDVNAGGSEKAKADLLGYAQRIEVNGVPRLHRNLPARHPRWPWMVCTRVVAKDYKFLEKADYLAGPAAAYHFTRLTCVFTTVPYNVISDSDLSQYGSAEWNRFTEIYYEPGLETITPDRGAFKWADGPGAGTDINFGLPQLLSKPTIRMVWRDVPENCLYDVDGIPTNVEALQGRVNSATFRGHPAGTLLCISAKTMPRYAPVAPSLVGLNDDHNPPRVFDVEYLLKKFDPPYGNASYRGHNLGPYANADRYWWLITTDGTTAGGRLLPSLDFNDYICTVI